MHFITKAADDIGKLHRYVARVMIHRFEHYDLTFFNYLQCNVRWVWCLFLNFLGGITEDRNVGAPGQSFGALD